MVGAWKSFYLQIWWEDFGGISTSPKKISFHEVQVLKSGESPKIEDTVDSLPRMLKSHVTTLIKASRKGLLLNDGK